MKISTLQKKESQLGVYQTFITLMTPLSLTLVVGTEFARLWIAGMIGISCAAVIFLQARRIQYRSQIRESYENLQTGMILKSRFLNTPSHRFVITQLTPQYYHLKGLHGEKQFVLSRKKAIDSYFVESEEVTSPGNSPEMAKSNFVTADPQP